MSHDQMQRQRFEQKYRLDEAQALAVREFVQEYLPLDENGVGKPDLSYPVHSLYLDSDSLTTYWATVNGDKNRFKLRLRFYNDLPDSPVFFEIKRRMDKCILKQRGGVRKEAVPWVLAGQLPEPGHLISNDPRHLVAVQRFCELAQELQATPRVHVAYLREAWVPPDDNSVRVTMDRVVQTEPRFTATFGTAVKHGARPFGREVVLELKFSDRYPLWFREVVEHFDLVQCAAAKYCEGVEAIGIERLSGPHDVRNRA